MLTKTQITGIRSDLDRDGVNLAIIFQALGDNGRLKIFKLLIAHHDICVTDVANVFEISISAASQQLRVLERLGLVEKNENGANSLLRTKKGQPGCRATHSIFKVERVIKIN